MKDQETRIAFAERQGWTWLDEGFTSHPYPGWYLGNSNLFLFAATTTELPIIDHNNVHTALMGMSGNEWELFITLLLDKSWEELQHFQSPYFESVMKSTAIAILKTPLPIIVTCFLEATKGRVK